MRILVADDHDIIRRGLKELLTSRPGWEVCAEAKTGREAVTLAERFGSAASAKFVNGVLDALARRLGRI